ncbi:MAG: LemA family protein [Clostridium sp.]
MNTSKKTILIIVGVILIIGFLMGFSYNGIVNLEQTANVQESNIDTQLQRRNDLIPNLVNTVKGYASQEKDIFTDIANARAKLSGATSVKDQAQADSELSNALSRLLVVVERYPDLKSNQNFRDLQVQLEGTENRIAIARQDYNTAATAYNTKIKKFPNNLFSGIFGFTQKELYKASAGAENVPSVDFNK